MSSGVTVVIVTRNRPEELRRCLASVLAQTVAARLVVLDNCSDDDKQPVVPDGCRLLRTEVPMGAAAAKNLAFRHVEDPISVLLDDDAEVASRDAFERIVRVFRDREDLAAVALNCLAVGAGDDGGVMEQMRLVHGIRDSTEKLVVGGEVAVPCAEFVGAGCAFRTGLFQSVGGFREDYLYGYEEFHLTLRFIDRGCSMLYLPDVKVLHYHSTTWRLPEAVRFASQLRNKWALAGELIPVPWIPIALIPFTVRMLATLSRSGTGVANPLVDALGAFAHAWRDRRPLRTATVRQALLLRGRL